MLITETEESQQNTAMTYKEHALIQASLKFFLADLN